MNIIKRVKDQSGFAHSVIIPIAVVVLVIIAIGVTVYNSQSTRQKKAAEVGESVNSAPDRCDRAKNQKACNSQPPTASQNLDSAPTGSSGTSPNSTPATNANSSPTNTPVSFSVISSGNYDPARSYPFNPNTSDYPYEYKLESGKLTVYLGYRSTGGYSIAVKTVSLQQGGGNSTYVVHTQETKPGPSCPLTSAVTYPYQKVSLDAGSNPSVSNVSLQADAPIVKNC